jgi:hypothetical protein
MDPTVFQQVLPGKTIAEDKTSGKCEASNERIPASLLRPLAEAFHTYFLQTLDLPMTTLRGNPAKWRHENKILLFSVRRNNRGCCRIGFYS